MRIDKAAWGAIGVAVLGLAGVSLLFNVSLPWEMAGHWKPYSCVRKSITKVLSSGTAWAAVSIYAGWRVRRLVLSPVAGIVAAEATLIGHYVLGLLVGVYDIDVFAGNMNWFESALVLCGPLGWCGWLAARAGWAGLAARLVVPAGALVEPFWLRKFSPMPLLPWPESYSDIAGGVLLVLCGIGGTIVVLRRGRPGFPHPELRPRVDGSGGAAS